MEQYSIGVTGQVLQGFEPADVQQRLSALFKCSPEKALRLMSGKPVVLKKGLDREATARFRQQLLKAGVEPLIKKMSPAAPAVAPSAASSPSPRTSADAASPNVPQMSCPKCGASQPVAEICARCGLVIAKFRNDPLPAVEQPQFTAEPLSELEELGLVVDHNFPAYRHKFQDLLANRGKYVFHWHWPAFFIAIPWLLYRKMFLHAFIFLVLAMIPLPFSGLLLAILCGALGNYLYFRNCRSQIAAVKTKGPERYRTLASAGGTLSVPVAILASIVVLSLGAYANYHLLYKGRIGSLSDDPMVSAAQGNGESGKQTFGKMMVIGEFLRVYMAAERMSGKQSAPPESIGDIQRIFKLDAKAIRDEWGTELDFVKDGGRSMLVSAGPDQEFSTEDDLTYEVRL